MKFPTVLAAAVFAVTPLVAADKLPVLLVLTNHGDLGNTGKSTGFFLGEAAHPWEVFEAAGYPVRIASPEGGFAPLDPKSLDLSDSANATFWEKFAAKKDNVDGIADTVALRDVTPSDYAGVFFVGGHGTMWDFADSEVVQSVTARIYEQGGTVAAVCHGPAALVNVKLSDGKPLVAGKKIATFTNAEEEAVDLTDVVPYLLETKLAEAGATIVPAANFQENAIRDGRLVTGQNPASAKKTATLMVEAMAQGN